MSELSAVVYFGFVTLMVFVYGLHSIDATLKTIMDHLYVISKTLTNIENNTNPEADDNIVKTPPNLSELWKNYKRHLAEEAEETDRGPAYSIMITCVDYRRTHKAQPLHKKRLRFGKRTCTTWSEWSHYLLPNPDAPWGPA